MTTRFTTDRRGRDPAFWLARALREGRLLGLPPFASCVDGHVHQAEPYALALLASLRGRADAPADLERARDDARAFRSWVERGRVESHPARAQATTPRPSPPGA